MKRLLQFAAFAIALLMIAQPALAGSSCGPMQRAAEDCAALSCDRTGPMGIDRATGMQMGLNCDAGPAYAGCGCVEARLCIAPTTAFAELTASYNQVADQSLTAAIPMDALSQIARQNPARQIQRQSGIFSPANPRYILLHVFRV